MSGRNGLSHLCKPLFLHTCWAPIHYVMPPRGVENVNSEAVCIEYDEQ